MKILFYGAHLKHYYLAKWLRSKGLECDIFLLDRKKANSLPEWDDSSLIGNYPSWIYEFYSHENKFIKKLQLKLTNSGLLPISFVKYINKYDFFPRKKIKNLSQSYDLIFTSGGQYILPALNLGVPVVHRAIGSDFTRLPFSCNSIYQEVLSYAFRKWIKKVKCIIAYQNDTIQSMKLLGVFDKVKYFSCPTSIEEIKANMDKVLLKDLNERYSQYDYVFFLPARKVLNPNHSAYKGQEKFLNALKKLLEINSNIRVIAIMSGSGVKIFRRLIKYMKLEKYFDFINSYLPIYKLSAYMKIRNSIVFNDFGHPKVHLTGTSREVLSVGAILVDGVKTDDPHFKMLYGENCPLLKAFDEQTILCKMKKIISMNSNTISRLKKESLNWAYKYLHWENKIDELIEILKNSI